MSALPAFVIATVIMGAGALAKIAYLQLGPTHALAPLLAPFAAQHRGTLPAHLALLYLVGAMVSVFVLLALSTNSDAFFWPAFIVLSIDVIAVFVEVSFM